MNKLLTSKKINIYLFATVAALFSILIMTMPGFADWDFLWHTEFGKYIIKNHQMPISSMSWYGDELGYSVFAHSWLTGVIMYCLSSMFNIFHGVVIYCFITSFIFHYIIGYCCKDNLNIFSAIIPLFFTASFFANPRPGNISISLFLLIGIFLNKYKNENNIRYLIYIPLLSLIAANIHGGTVVLIPPLIFIYGFINLLPSFNYSFLTHNQVPLSYFKKYLIVFLTSIGCICINPYGIKLFTYFFKNNTSSMKMYVGEFQPSKLSEVIFAIIALLLYLFIIKKINLNRFLLYIMCLCSCMIWRRMNIYINTISIILILEALTHIKYSYSKKTESCFNLFIICVLIILIFGGPKSQYPSEAIKTTSTLSNDIVFYIKNANLNRMANNYDDGAKLIHEGIPSFINSMADPFDDYSIAKTIEAYNMTLKNETIESYLAKFNFDSILVQKIPRTYGFQEYLKSHDWYIGFENNNYIIYRK